MSSTRPTTRRRVAGVIAGATALGLVVASAASLGGLTSESLGAADTVVASCDTDGVALGYTNAYDAASGKYRTTGVTVTDIAAGCTGDTLEVTLRDAAGAALGGGSTTVTGTSATLQLATPVPAEAVTGAAVVIHG